MLENGVGSLLLIFQTTHAPTCMHACLNDPDEEYMATGNTYHIFICRRVSVDIKEFKNGKVLFYGKTVVFWQF